MINVIESCSQCGHINTFQYQESRLAEDARARNGGSRILHLFSEGLCILCDDTSGIHDLPTVPVVWPEPPLAAEDDDDQEDDLPF